MKISVAQIDVVYKDTAKNIQAVCRLFSSVPEVGDLVLQPELFTTGYLFNHSNELCAAATNALPGKTTPAKTEYPPCEIAIKSQR